VALGGAAAGAVLAVVADAGLAGLVLLTPTGAAAGAGAVLVRARRRSGRPLLPERIDPFAVKEPWRHHVRGALQARNRFAEAARSLPAGPLRDRLDDLRRTIDDGVRETWEVAKRAQAIADARRQVDADRLRRRLAELGPGDEPPALAPGDATTDGEDADATGTADGDDHAAGTDDRPTAGELAVPDDLLDEPADPAAATRAALESQIATAERLDRLVAETRSRLDLLEVRLSEAVTRTIEVGAVAGTDTDLTTLRSDLGGVVDELEALRRALADTDAADGR
jgi:hypothetical protein